MGKKSNAKKIIRELIKEKKQKEKQKNKLLEKIKKEKSKKQLKKELINETRKIETKNGKKPKSSRKKLIEKRQFFGAVLSTLILFILVFTGVFLFNKAFKPKLIANFLPQNRTVFTLEINTDFEHNQVQKALKLLEKYPQYSKEGLIGFIENHFSLNYLRDVRPWLGRQAGIAMIKDENAMLETVYFAEVSKYENAKNFLSGKSMRDDYAGREFYLFANGYNGAFIDDYLFLTTNKKLLEELLDFQNSDEEMLVDSAQFRRVHNNLPYSRNVFFYIDFTAINDGFFHKFPFIAERGFNFSLLQPFLNLMKSEGMALIALDDRFALQSFISLKEKKKLALKPNKKYNAELAAYVLHNAYGFWGGENLELQLQRLVEMLSTGEIDASFMFDRLLTGYVHKFFGPETNLVTDILPLFKKEYALAVEEFNGKKFFKFLLEIEKGDEEKIHLFADRFAQLGAVLKPQIVDYTLPDGTRSKEIVAIPEPISREEKQYQNFKLYTLNTGSNGIHYANLGELLVISNHVKGIENTVNLKIAGGKNLKNSVRFQSFIKPLLTGSDEISYADFEKILPLLFGRNIPEFLIPIESLSSGRNYFNDGIISITYLHID